MSKKKLKKSENQNINCTENTENTKNTQNIWYDIIYNIVIFIIPLVPQIFDYVVSVKYEEFYGVPKFYFNNNLQQDYIIQGVFVISIMLLFSSPYIIKRILKKTKLNYFESLLSIIPGIFSFCLLFSFNIFIVDEYNFYICFMVKIFGLKVYAWIIFFICIFLSLLIGIIYFLVCSRDEKKGTIISLFKGIVVLMVLISMLPTLRFTPSNKKQYEIIQGENSEYNIIVGYYKDLAIVMKKEFLENGKIKIKKGDYKIESIEGKEISYFYFDEVCSE